MKLPLISSREMGRVLSRFGFALRRVRGSHYIFVRAETEVIVPLRHTLARGTVCSILTAAGIERAAYLSVLQNTKEK